MSSSVRVDPAMKSLLVAWALFGVLALDGRAYAFKPGNHMDITAEGIGAVSPTLSTGIYDFSAAAVVATASANALTDLNQFHAAWHFDAESILDGNSRLVFLRRIVVETLLNIPLDASHSTISLAAAEARTHLGIALHALQDYYSHSNWVERGNQDINHDLGAADPAGIPTLSTEETNTSFTGLCQVHEGSPFGDELSTEGKQHPTTGYFDNWNYLAGICVPRAPHKCGHGWKQDAVICLGINKDEPAPANPVRDELHRSARNLAVLATTSFVSGVIEDIRSSPLPREQQEFAILALLGQEPRRKLTVTVVGGGVVTADASGIGQCESTCTAIVANETSVTLIAQEKTGFRFEGWSGDCTGSTPTLTQTLTQDRTCVATFKASPVVNGQLKFSGRSVFFGPNPNFQQPQSFGFLQTIPIAGNVLESPILYANIGSPGWLINTNSLSTTEQGLMAPIQGADAGIDVSTLSGPFQILTLVVRFVDVREITPGAGIRLKAQVLHVARCDACIDPLLTQFTSTPPTQLTIDVPTLTFPQLLSLPAFTSIQAPYAAVISNLP